MKATLVFDLPDDSYEHKCALKGHDFSCCISDIRNHIRSILKHGSPSTETAEQLEIIRGMLPYEDLD